LFVGSDGPKASCVTWDPDPQWEGAILGEMGTHCKLWTLCGTCAKTAEPVEMPFALWAWSGSRNHELDGV